MPYFGPNHPFEPLNRKKTSYAGTAAVILALLACLWFFPASGQAAVITVNSGETVPGVLGTPQADEITVEQGAKVQDVVSGAGGDDYIVNSGDIGGHLAGFDQGEGGSPTVINKGVVRGKMVGAQNGTSDGDVVLVDNQGLVGGDLSGGFCSRGTFTVKNSGTVKGTLWGVFEGSQSQHLGDGYAVKIYNSGTVEGFIYGSYTSGVRTYIENSGIVIGDIWASSLGLGASTIVNRGEVRSSIFGGMDDDTIILVGGSKVGGTVDALDGNDTLILDNMGAQDGSLWGGPGGKYYDFENLSFTGADNRLTGTWQISDVPVTVYDGALTLQKSASIHAASLDVQQGGAASLLGAAKFTGGVTVSGSLASWGGLSAGSLLVNPGGSTVFYGSTAFGGVARVNGNLVNRGDFSAAGLYIGSPGSARLYGESAVSGRVANAGSLLVGGDLNAGHVESSGELRVNGVLTCPEVIITQSGELFGSGRIKAGVTNSGAVSPGNSAGTLTIEGDYTHNRTAVMITEAAADGQTDLLYVTNRARINGGTLRVALEKALYADKTSWTVIRADGGLYGNFARMEGLENSAVLDFETLTTPNSLMVRLNRRDYADFAANPNDAQIAHALDRLLFSSTGELKEMLMSMDWNMSAAQIRRALDELSPEMYTAFEPASFELGLVFDRAMALRMEQLDLKGPAGKNAAGTVLLAAGRAGLVLPLNEEAQKGWAFWGRGLGHWSNRDSSRDYLGWDQKASGAVLGVDAAISPRFTLGASLAATKSDLNWTKEGMGGDLNGLHAGFYGRAEFGPGRLRGSFSYARLSADAEREIDYPGFSATAKGSFDANLLGAWLEYGYALRPGGWLLEPTAALGYQYLDRDDFRETGAGTLGMLVEANSADQFSSRLGARLARDFRSSEWSFSPCMGLYWIHCFDGSRPEIKAAFPDRSDVFLTVQGLEQPEDSIQLQAGLDAALNRHLSVFADYGFTYSGQGSGQSLSAGLMFKF